KRELVNTLNHDNEILNLELTRESREVRKAGSSSAAAEIARLQEEGNAYLKRIEVERKKIEELDGAIAKFQEKILEQKKSGGGVNASVTHNQIIQKQIKVLENRLDKCLLKFNDTLAQNKELRMKIDDYRRERVVFDAIYKKLEKELHEKKREMQAIIEDSKAAYQNRDKAQSEMINMQHHADKERAEFEGEFKELGELIKQQQAVLEQMRLRQLELAQEEQTLATTSQVDNKSDDKSAQLSQEKIQSYENALQQIQDATGVYDVNEIVTRFLEAEEQNFSLFNYVNDINSEIERLEHSIAEMRSQIEKYRGQGMSTDTMRKKALKELEEKLNRTQKKAEEYEVRQQKASRTILQLKNGIHSIFTRIGAATTSVEEMLGNQGVTESNMMQYLGVIEQRTTEILQAYAASQIGQTNESSLQLPSVLAMEQNTTKFAVAIPSYEDMSSGEESDSEEDERPLTRQELDKRTLREFSRKGGGARLK
ncbi:unnamed protein product, partial [Ectocarpus fasciculatus]